MFTMGTVSNAMAFIVVRECENVSVCVCVCVCERERAGEREKGGEQINEK